MPLTIINKNNQGNLSLVNNNTGGSISFSLPSIYVDSIRAALSTSVATYDAAAINTWIKVTDTEYANVQSTIAGVNTRGLTNTQANESGRRWTGTCAQILPSGSITSPAGEYIIAFSARSEGPANISVLVSTSYTGTYTVLSNSPALAGGVREYYVRKTPTTPNASTTYVGSVTSTGIRVGTMTTISRIYDCSSPYSTWTSGAGTAAIFQFIGTSIKSW